MENNKTGNLGSMIGIIIVILVLITGAFYFVGQRIEKQKEFQATINQAQVSTTSDDLSSIENDANSMNFDNLGDGIDKL